MYAVSQKIMHTVIDNTYIFLLLIAFLCWIIHITSAAIIVAIMSKNNPTVINMIIIVLSEFEFPVDSKGVTELLVV